MERSYVAVIIILISGIALGWMLREAYAAQAGGCDPADRLASTDIAVYQTETRISTASMGRRTAFYNFADTHSMQPAIGHNANTIEFVPISPADIRKCDIITVNTTSQKMPNAHRVMDIGQDESGTYYVTKGDNNIFADPERVRFSQVEGVVFAIVY